MPELTKSDAKLLRTAHASRHLIPAQCRYHARTQAKRQQRVDWREQRETENVLKWRKR